VGKILIEFIGGILIARLLVYAFFVLIIAKEDK
jgi:hypothetical protein